MENLLMQMQISKPVDVNSDPYINFNEENNKEAQRQRHVLQHKY